MTKTAAVAPTRNFEVKTPGVVAPATASDGAFASPLSDVDVQANAEANESLVGVEPLQPIAQSINPDAPAAEQLVTLSISDLNAMVARNVAQAMAAQASGQRDPVTRQQLPDASSIDPTTITRMVLTKDGYVVPKETGPNQLDRDALLNQRR